MVLILMGVSGCGKTTIGNHLSEHLQLPFYDGDDFHPPENVEKMKSGLPLNDEDRRPWLDILHKKIKEWNQHEGAVLACSALKSSYRQRLRGSLPHNQVIFIFLKGSADLIRKRLLKREGHYMPAGLLDSQFRDLEQPVDAITVRIDRDVDEIVDQILQKLNEKYGFHS